MKFRLASLYGLLHFKLFVLDGAEGDRAANIRTYKFELNVLGEFKRNENRITPRTFSAYTKEVETSFRISSRRKITVSRSPTTACLRIQKLFCLAE